jgi:hypothetical protein
VPIDPRSDAALRGLLDECRAGGIRAALLLMPEPRDVRAWCTPPSRARVQAYLAELGREYGVPILDTRDWSPDEDFPEYCHLSPQGADAYSRLFGALVLRPLLAGSGRIVNRH